MVSSLSSHHPLNPRTTTTMVDRISTLPDEVISHILSFLATEEAVSTSVLSKRWYPLWRSLSTLDLSDELVPHHDENAYLRYKEFVLSVLLLRDPIQPIKRFGLQHHRYDNPSLNKWVSVVLQRRVQFLLLKMCNRRHKLPVRVFACRTLVVLMLDLFYVNVNDVSYVELPLLKALHLMTVEFAECRVLSELLSGCPNLKDFVLRHVLCVNADSKGDFKSLTKLMRATIRDCDLEFPLEALYNVEYLELDICNKVSRWYDHMPAFYNLTQLKLFFYESWWRWLSELLSHCPKLQIIGIHKMFESKPDDNWVCPSFVSGCVSSYLRECTIFGYGGMEGELQFARYMLQNARVLQTMTIHSNSSSNSDKKLQILQELSLCPRSSATCKLVFT